MRARALIIIGILALPSGANGQGVRLPRRGQPTPTQPAAPPPEVPVVARALAYKRSRWSTEGYSLISTIQLPAAVGGGLTSYTTYGVGTHADFRYSERFSATADLTVSPLGGTAITETGEVGARFSPLPWERGIRPFVDVRGVYMHMYDTFASSVGSLAAVGVSGQQLAQEGRYSRGLGGAAGAGVEFPVTSTLALTSEISGLRNRMTTYRLTGPANIPSGTSYWMTSLRVMLGFKYSPVRMLHSTQTPGS